MGIQETLRNRLVPRVDDGTIPRFHGMEVRLRGVDTRRFGASRRAASAFVVLELGDPIGVTTHLRLVTNWLRLARRLGLANRAPSGVPDFDRRVHVDCDDPAYARELLTAPARRAAISALLDATPRPAAIGLGDEGAWATFPGEATPDDEELRALLPLLRSLRRNLPDVGGRRQGVRKSHRRQIWYAVAYGGFALAFVLAAGLIRPPTTPGMSLLPGVACGTVFALVVLVASMVRLRGRSATTAEFRLLAILTVVVAIFFGLVGRQTAAWLNARHDDSRGEVHIQKVVRKWVDERHNGSVYRMVAINPWRPGQDPLETVVSRAEHDTIEVGQSVTIVTHPGAYGWEWIDPIDWTPPEPESDPQ